jgi:hypothetical protein
MTIKELIAVKLTSAQFIMAVLFSSTYCLIMIGCTIALIMKLFRVETYIALVSAFAIIVREIADDYFKRDRTKENRKGEVQK